MQNQYQQRNQNFYSSNGAQTPYPLGMRPKTAPTNITYPSYSLSQPFVGSNSPSFYPYPPSPMLFPTNNSSNNNINGNPLVMNPPYSFVPMGYQPPLNLQPIQPLFQPSIPEDNSFELVTTLNSSIPQTEQPCSSSYNLTNNNNCESKTFINTTINNFVDNSYNAHPKKKCKRCEKYYTDVENGDKACRFHPGHYRTVYQSKMVAGNYMLWSCCQQASKEIHGCHVGAHVECKNTTQILAHFESLQKNSLYSNVNNNNKIEEKNEVFSKFHFY